MHRIVCALGVLAAVATSASEARAEQELFSDSGIDGPPYREIYDNMGALAATHASWAAVADYGRTPGGRDLRVIKIQAPGANRRDARPAVLISGSTHGNEYLNIEDRLPQWLLENRTRSPGLRRYLAAGGVIYVVPILNPDGYDRDTRGNGNGVDLNRDFDLVPVSEDNFREVETRSLVEFLDRDFEAENVELKLTVDYHCCDGSLLFPWSYTMDALSAEDYQRHLVIGQLMQTHIDDTYEYGSTGQVLGYNPRGTSKDFYYARYGALAFTFEGSYANENRRFAAHTIWWDHMLGTIVPTED
jgi:hypothetical protein